MGIDAKTLTNGLVTMTFTCIQLSKSITNLTTRFANSEKSLQHVVEGLKLLRKTLAGIQTSIMSDPEEFELRVDSLDQFSRLFSDAFRNCAALLSDFNKAVSALNNTQPHAGKSGITVGPKLDRSVLASVMQALNQQDTVLNLLVYLLEPMPLQELRGHLNDTDQAMKSIIQSADNRPKTDCWHLTQEPQRSGSIERKPVPVRPSKERDAQVNGHEAKDVAGPLRINASSTLIDQGSQMTRIELNSVQSQQNQQTVNYGTHNPIRRLIGMIKDSRIEEALVLLNSVSLDVNDRDRDGTTALIEATKKGNIKIVEKLVDLGASTEIVDESKKNALLWAAELGKPSVANLLIQRGAKIETRGKDNMSVLNQAAHSGHRNVVELLLENGADIEARDDDQMTPLHSCAQFPHEDVVGFLLDKGANVRARDRRGNTALHFAAASAESAGTIRRLLRAKAALEDINKSSQSPLYIATFHNQKQSLSELISAGARLDVVAEDKFTPLHEAVCRGHVEVTELLLSELEKRNTKSSQNLSSAGGRTSLHHAAMKGNAAIVELLLKHGANAWIADDGGYLPIHRAAQHGQNEAIGIFLKAKILIDVQIKAENSSRTALHEAAWQDQAETVSFLIQKGADKESQLCLNQMTPLHCASMGTSLDAAKCLLKQGAKINVQNANGETPLGIAASNGGIDIMKLLISSGANMDLRENDGQLPIHRAASNGQVDSVKWLIESGAPVDVADSSGNTALHLAAGEGHTNVVQLLVESGHASISARDKDWSTCLHHASYSGHFETISYLLKNGVAVDAVNKNNQTALIGAASSGIVAAVELLLKHGAQVNASSGGEARALDFAVMNHKSAVVKYLLQNGARILPISGSGDQTALHLAAEVDEVESIEILLSYGALIHGRALTTKETPLITAADNGSINAVQILLQKGAALEGMDNDGQTALIRAVYAGHIEVTKLLLERGAYIHTQNSGPGMRPIHVAAATGNVAMVRLLLAKGASAKSKTREGNTPRSYAERFEPRSGVVEILKAARG